MPSLKEWSLLALSIAATLVLSVGAIRWFAPGLLGIPIDVQMVTVSKGVAPFFDSVFRSEDYSSSEFIISDPYIMRAKPLLPDINGSGPHDILGFRNVSVPHYADLIAIGDSQTYGLNAPVEGTWPSHLIADMHRPDVVMYNMAVGGWGAVQYLEIFYKALLLRPQVVVVAFYSGNDALESYRLAYSNERWANLRPGPAPNNIHIPEMVFPAPTSDKWHVKFGDGSETVFTPKLRYSTNLDHPVVKAGYEVMARAARQMSGLAKKHHIKLIFTVIPTKELAYKRKIEAEVKSPDRYYQMLIPAEEGNITWLEKEIAVLPGVTWMDVVDPLQQAVLRSGTLYPEDENGHPFSEGYAVIGRTLAKVVEPLLTYPPQGLVKIFDDIDGFPYMLATDHGKWTFVDESFAVNSGWSLSDALDISYRDIAGLPWLGYIKEASRDRFGPDKINSKANKVRP